MSFSRELNFATKNDKKEITENDQINRINRRYRRN